MKPRDYTVYCHRCPFESAAHPRSTSREIGSPEYGALWHCPDHAPDCPTCPRGRWTDPHPADPGPYTERRRHRARRPINISCDDCGRAGGSHDPEVEH